MDATAPGQWRERLPGGFLGMVALVALIELFLARHDIDFQTPGSLLYRFTRCAVQREAPQAEVLCLGDSLVKLDVMPRILEKRLGRPAYNLANSGAQPPATYFLLRRALALGARPNVLLVDFKANIIQADPRSQVPETAELMSLRDCLDLGWTTRDASYFAALTLARLWPALRFRETIRSHLLASLNGADDPEHETIRTWWRNWSVNLGAHVAARNPAVRYQTEFREEKWLFPPDRWNCHPLNRIYMERFLALAAAQEIPVFWLVPPIHPRIQARRERRGLDAAYVQFARDLQARFPNVSIIDGRHAGYEAALFIDSAHLDRQGACAFSAAVADIVARRLKEPGQQRWIDLPAYRATDADALVEDMNQSRAAIQSDAGHP